MAFKRTFFNLFIQVNFIAKQNFYEGHRSDNYVHACNCNECEAVGPLFMYADRILQFLERN